MIPSVKPLPYIEIDRTDTIRSLGNYSESSITMYRDSSYVVISNCVTSVNNSNAFVFDSGDIFYAAIGDKYGTAESPVVTISPSSFNSLSDWAMADPTQGRICFRANTTSEKLANDLGNSSSKTYRMDVWVVNTNNETVLLSQSDVKMNNVAVEVS